MLLVSDQTIREVVNREAQEATALIEQYRKARIDARDVVVGVGSDEALSEAHTRARVALADLLRIVGNW